MPPQHHRTLWAGRQLRWRKRRVMGVEENPARPNRPSPLHNYSYGKKGERNSLLMLFCVSIMCNQSGTDFAVYSQT